MNLYFTYDSRGTLNSFTLFIAVKTISKLNAKHSDKYEIKILVVVIHVLQTTQNLVISRCWFVEDGKEMYKDSKRTCTAIVLLFKPFVWWRSHCRRRRGFVNSLIDPRRSQIVVRTKTAIIECVTDVRVTFWGLFCPIILVQYSAKFMHCSVAPRYNEVPRYRKKCSL